jgi:choline dehydrogenase
MQNLRVIDASIMPTMPSANLNAGVLMIAENSADLMLETPPL